MTARGERRPRPRVAPRPPRVAPDATTEPEPGPPPEAVFDRVTGPNARLAVLARPGHATRDEVT